MVKTVGFLDIFPATPWSTLYSQAEVGEKKKIPGTANISVNTFISMRIYIQFLCSRGEHSQKIFCSIHLYLLLSTFMKLFNVQIFLLPFRLTSHPYFQMILAIQNWHFSTCYKFLQQQNDNISPSSLTITININDINIDTKTF